MAHLAPQLPTEVWVHVFRYVSTADKLSIRTCCKYFKKLVDHGSLWKDCTVILSFKNGSYSPQFWSILRRRKIVSVVVQSTKAKDWKQLVSSLPTLTTIVMEHGSQQCLDYLKKFPNLKRLAIRDKPSPLLMNSSIVSHPQQLTHFSLCHVNCVTPTKDTIVAFFSQFTNLTSLVYHQEGNHGDPRLLLLSIITCMPKLRHLSWATNRRHSILPKRYPNPSNVSQGSLREKGAQSGSLALSSLELVDYMDPSLSKDTMKSMPCLKSLAVQYKHSHDEMNITWEYDVCHLKTWLSDLHQLSALAIVRGPPPHEYVSSIPATVTSLTLCVGHLSLKDMVTIAAQVPSLFHLHLDLWPSFSGIGQIPKLFPQLRSLKFRHEHIMEKDFLSLQRLQNLKSLEIMDAYHGPSPYLSELIRKLQTLTNYRIQVITSPLQRDPLACYCTHQVY